MDTIPSNNFPMTQAGYNQLISDEEFRQFVYDDASGRQILRGPSGGYPTVGIGRNLVSKGVTRSEALFLFNNDIKLCWSNIAVSKLNLSNLPAVAKDILIMIEFNTGNVFQFAKMLSAMLSGDWNEASVQLLASKAANQAPARYHRMAKALIDNAWPNIAMMI